MQNPDGVLEIKRDWLGRIKTVSYKCGELDKQDRKSSYHKIMAAVNVISDAVAGER